MNERTAGQIKERAIEGTIKPEERETGDSDIGSSTPYLGKISRRRAGE